MRRAVLVGLSVLGLIGTLAVAPASAAPVTVPTPLYFALGVQASAGADSGGAAESGGAVEVTGDGVDKVALDADTARFTSSGGTIRLDLFAPTGTSWETGQVLAVSTSGGTDSAIVRVGNLPNRDCTTLGASSGSVTIVDATYDGDALTAFGADLQVACGSDQYSAYVRWHSQVDYAGLTLTESVAYPTVSLGAYTDRTVTLTATGTQPLPFIDDATFGGAQPEAFSVVGNDCKQQALAAGTSCSIVVRARPLVAGNSTGTLVLVHDTATPWEVALSAGATDVAEGTYRTFGPTRLLDTRSGLGGHRGPLPSGGILHLVVTRSPATVSAVVLNLTVDRPSKPGYLTAYPTGKARPTTSSINFPAGWQGANLVTVPVGAGGQIDIYNYLGNTSVIADIVGYYAKGTAARSTGGGYHPTLVERLLDTRTWGYGKLPAGAWVSIPVSYKNDDENIAAMSVTVTAVRPTTQGYLTTWNNGPSIPKTSTLNFNRASGVISNAAIVPAGYNDSSCPQCAWIAVRNVSSAPIDLVVDINGFFDHGGLVANYRYRPLASPTRIVDSRSGLGTTPFGPGTTHTVTAPTSVAGYDTVALDSNVTAVAPSLPTYVTVWPTYDDYPRPVASLLNPNAKQTIANHAIAEVGYSNRFNLFNAAGTNNLLVDVSGTFELYPHTPADQLPRGKNGAVVERPAAQAAGGNTAGIRPSAHSG
ncbi:choice-of-anchor D domain-containing protein [Jatrophihabitans sp. YIM 134969]